MTKPLRPAATPGRLPRRKRRLASLRLARVIPVLLALVGAIALILLVLGVFGVHAVTDHFRVHQSARAVSGQRTRPLTPGRTAADWDEDFAGSPNGKLLALWTNRTMHFTDWFAGLLPVRDFIDAPAPAAYHRCRGERPPLAS